VRAASFDTPTQPIVRRRRSWWWVAVAAIAVLGIGAPIVFNRSRAVDVQSVAVLPPAGSADDALARGITEEITDDLSRARGLRVEEQPAAQAALESTLERADGRMRLVLHLTRTDGRYWERTVERPATELSSLPADAAAFISSDARKRAPKHKPKQGAYEPYLEGRGWLARQDEASWNKAIDCFQRAVNADPDFALGWAWLSIAREYAVDAGAARPNEMLPPARDAAERAVTLGPDIAEAHAALGIVRLQYDWDWSTARHELDRALQLSPGSRVAKYWLARSLEATGHAAPRALTFAHLPPHDGDAAARKLLADADDIRVESYISPVALAQVANSLHDTEGVFHWLEIAYDERSPQLPYAVWDPALPRSDPRMADLMQRLKLSPTN
jgi:tetratricopeptide (TPR) repeat protein